MWEMVSELLEGEKLPVSMNEAIEGLCNGDLVIAERHEFRKLEADNHALKAQIEYLKKAQAEIENLKRANRHEHIVAENALKETDCYGDGNVYRGVRSKDSAIQTIHIDKTTKTLTDEEITAIWQTDECYQKAQNFARAILKRASEK
jgi:hypothetical protein